MANSANKFISLPNIVVKRYWKNGKQCEQIHLSTYYLKSNKKYWLNGKQCEQVHLSAWYLCLKGTDRMVNSVNKFISLPDTCV